MIFNPFALIEMRRLRGMSQADLVRADDVSPSYLSALESGDRERPSAERVAGLAIALDVDPFALFVDPSVDRLLEELVLAVGADEELRKRVRLTFGASS